jgi:hypothetical protein
MTRWKPRTDIGSEKYVFSRSSTDLAHGLGRELARTKMGDADDLFCDL